MARARQSLAAAKKGFRVLALLFSCCGVCYNAGRWRPGEEERELQSARSADRHTPSRRRGAKEKRKKRKEKHAHTRSVGTQPPAMNDNRFSARKGPRTGASPANVVSRDADGGHVALISALAETLRRADDNEEKGFTGRGERNRETSRVSVRG